MVKLNLILFPGIRLLLIATLGAFLGYLLKFDYNILTAFLILSLICLFFAKFRVIFYYTTAFCLGIWFIFQLNQINPKIPEKIYQEFPALVQGEIVKIIKISNNQAKIIVDGTIDAQPLPILHNQKILLTIYGLKSKNLTFQPGMHIFADINTRAPRKPQLPTDFPENNYAASLDVKWIASSPVRNIAIISPAQGYKLILHNLVQNIQNRINVLFSKNSAPIITALITGDKTKIPYETKQLFSLSGTAHILAVSGLHVGIIATIIFFLLGFIKNNWLKFFVFSLMLCVFILLSGLQPSALRAGLMAVLFVYSKTLQRHTNALNIVTIAILIILIVYPEMFFSAGFQMSVSAIIGIVLLMKPIENIFKLFIKSNNFLINFIITSFTITLSASIIVTPLVAYYFKVFSIVSPIANLIVIPLMTLGMCFSIIALIFSYIYIPVAGIYALSADFLINLSQSINKWAVELPSAYLTGESLVFPAILISLAIIYLAFSSNIKQIIFRLILSSMTIIILLSVFNNQSNETLKIYPREQYVALILPAFNNSKSIILIDRKPAQKPHYDIGMMNYLKNIKSSFTIYYSGNAGLSIVDKLKYSQNIKFYEIDNNFQKLLQDLLKIKEPLPKIITENNG
jgi:competence protein ComEC